MDREEIGFYETFSREETEYSETSDMPESLDDIEYPYDEYDNGPEDPDDITDD